MPDEEDKVIHVSFRTGKRHVPVEAPPVQLDKGHRGGDPVRATYSATEVAKLFGVGEDRLRYWDRCGFVQPSARQGRRRLYTFQDLIGVKVTKGLLEKGLPTRSVKRSIEALRLSLPQVTRPLSELRVVADGRCLVVKDDTSSFEPTTGQLVLDFEVQSLRDEVVKFMSDHGKMEGRKITAYDYYLEGCRLDEFAESMLDAETAYRRALELDPSLANAWTNLGNLRFRTGHIDEAEQMYRRALTVDPEQPEALYNLGFLFYERGAIQEAVEHFRRALLNDVAFADAHFNLAMALEEIGQKAEAHRHWKMYLELDPNGVWADVARRHLEEMQ